MRKKETDTTIGMVRLRDTVESRSGEQPSATVAAVCHHKAKQCERSPDPAFFKARVRAETPIHQRHARSEPGADWQWPGRWISELRGNGPVRQCRRTSYSHRPRRANGSPRPVAHRCPISSTCSISASLIPCDGRMHVPTSRFCSLVVACVCSSFLPSTWCFRPMTFGRRGRKCCSRDGSGPSFARRLIGNLQTCL